MIINDADITDILETILNESDLIDDNVRIQSSCYINDNPTLARLGWIGIYKDSVKYAPNTLGGVNEEGVHIQWRFDGSFFALVQFSSMESGKVCNAGLEELVQKTILSIFNDQTLRESIDKINEVIVDYSVAPRFDSSEGSETVNFQQALITFKLEVDRR